VVAVGVISMLIPRPVSVDLFTVDAGQMIVTVDEEAETRVHDIFVLSAPVTGTMKRIEVEVGDPVIANETILAHIEPSSPTFLDTRSEAQAEAAVRAADSALALAQAEVDQALAELDFAEANHNRARELISDGTISRRDADEAERAYKTSRAAVATAQAALQMRTFELERAQAQLLSPTQVPPDAGECACIDLTAPIDGRVLTIANQSERVVVPGEALLEIGDARDLEVVADYLSTDAVKIEAGLAVVIDNWGGQGSLEGVVRLVEPFGYTKISALGIEEQRVNVIIDIASPERQWAKLGHGYQVETRVVLWESDDALMIPLTALFRSGDDWAAFVQEDGRASLRVVQLGRRNGLVAEIVDGLQAGERVVLHPSDRVLDGVKVVGRAGT
jgi:HlyD family secretion protein